MPNLHSLPRTFCYIGEHEGLLAYSFVLGQILENLDNAHVLTGFAFFKQGLVELKNIIQNTFKAHKSHQLPKYYVYKAITVLCEKVRECMSKTKLIPWVMSHSQNLVDEVSKIFEGTLSGTQLVHIFDLLHDQVKKKRNYIKFRSCRNNFKISLIFSSPEVKAQVSFSNRLLSVVRLSVNFSHFYLLLKNH